MQYRVLYTYTTLSQKHLIYIYIYIEDAHKYNVVRDNAFRYLDTAAVLISTYIDVIYIYTL